MEFTSNEALIYAKDNRVAEWVDLFLTKSRFSPNLDMAMQLRQRPTFWRGPVLTSLQSLVRVCGPEPEMMFKEDMEKWSCNVDLIVSLLEEGLDLPPLLIKIRNGKHFIADGAHRHEALIRKGRAQYWALWYAHEEKEFESVNLSQGV